VLDPVGGGVVAEALRRVARDLYHADEAAGLTRGRCARMAAALVELAVRATTGDERGRRPEPLVCVLAGEATVEWLCELADGTVIDPRHMVPYLDRAVVQTFIFDGADRVVSTSTQRSFTGRRRRAIQVRDRNCQHPAGCDTPIVDFDIDHTTAWAAGGETSEQGGRLQCAAHNRRSDLHHKTPHDILDDARHRRQQEAAIRRRFDALLAERHQRPPPPTTA